MGGDGLLQEVVTGLMRRPDREAVEQFPIGFIPIGTAGIMGSALHTHPDITATSKIGRAVLAVAQQKTRKIDVMEITNSKGQQIFATSCFGWGILGAMLNKIELHKGLGGQKYWYGAVETVAGYHGPVRRQASLQFRKGPGQPTPPPFLWPPIVLSIAQCGGPHQRQLRATGTAAASSWHPPAHARAPGSAARAPLLASRASCGAPRPRKHVYRVFGTPRLADASSRWESRDLDISSLIAANVPKSNLGTVDRGTPE